MLPCNSKVTEVKCRGVSLVLLQFFSPHEAANALHLQRARMDQSERRALDCYRARRKTKHMYDAAAKLWAEGVEWERGLAIVQEAFDASLVEL